MRPTRGPPGVEVGDGRALTLSLAEDRDRIAQDMSDIVVHRLFSAGLALESACGMMDGHLAAGKVQRALADLDQAIRDIRNITFDHYQRPSPPGEPLG